MCHLLGACICYVRTLPNRTPRLSLRCGKCDENDFDPKVLERSGVEGHAKPHKAHTALTAFYQIWAFLLRFVYCTMALETSSGQCWAILNIPKSRISSANGWKSFYPQSSSFPTGWYLNVFRGSIPNSGAIAVDNSYTLSSTRPRGSVNATNKIKLVQRLELDNPNWSLRYVVDPFLAGDACAGRCIGQIRRINISRLVIQIIQSKVKNMIFEQTSQPIEPIEPIGDWSWND